MHCGRALRVPSTIVFALAANASVLTACVGPDDDGVAVGTTAAGPGLCESLEYLRDNWNVSPDEASAQGGGEDWARGLRDALDAAAADAPEIAAELGTLRDSVGTLDLANLREMSSAAEVVDAFADRECGFAVTGE